MTKILRDATAEEPEDRPESLAKLVRGIEKALGHAEIVPKRETGELPAVGSIDTIRFSESVTVLGPEDVQIREAIDIYEKARLAWASGQGRFLLGVSHFMVMNDFFVNAEVHNLDPDEEGMQMLLRGALEYDYEIDHWWALLDNNARRWVCLHAIRSESAPARVRAFRRLETLPDADPPVIPRQVAQALQLETDDEARLAALSVLGTRAKLTQQRKTYEIETRFRGQLLSSLTRLELQTRPPDEWNPIVFTIDIVNTARGEVIAENALDTRAPHVAELAARVAGRIRSAEAVIYMDQQRREGQQGALRAMAFVRDETPSLPLSVRADARLYAWLANTRIRLTHDPMRIVWVFLLATAGGWLGMGQQVYRTFRTQGFFSQQRWANTLSFGLFFGLIAGLLTLLALEFPARLRGFWPRAARLAWSAAAAYFLGQTLWLTYTSLYLQNPQPSQPLAIFASVSTGIGIVLAAMFRLRGWVAVLITAVGAYIPIYMTYRSFWYQEPVLGFTFNDFILYYDNFYQVYTVAIPLVLLLALGVHMLAVAEDVRELAAKLRGTGKRKRDELAGVPQPLVMEPEGNFDPTEQDRPEEILPSPESLPVTEVKPAKVDYVDSDEYAEKYPDDV